jgi:enoyl-CoA hydratase/carnithine racemase
LTGAEAVECGLALKSVPDDKLADEVEALLSGLRDRPRAVLEVVKRTIHRGRGLPIAEGIEVEIEEFTHYMGELPYAREGLNASNENRDPSWIKSN